MIVNQGYRVEALLERDAGRRSPRTFQLLAGVGGSSKGSSPGQLNKEADVESRSPSEWWDTDILLDGGWPSEVAPGHGNSPSKSQREVLIQVGWREEMGGQQRSL